MKTLISALLFGACISAYACTLGTFEEEFEVAKAEYEMEVDFVKSIAKESDLIFIAKVEKVERDNDKSSDRVFFYEISVTLKDVIKGSFYKPIYRVEELSDRIELSCRVPSLRNSDSVYISYTYMFYVRDGKILRTTPFDKPFPYLTSDNELKLVEGFGF